MTNMTQRICEEVKTDYVEKMGKEFSTQFYALWQEFTWLAMKWGEYEALYGVGSKCVELLNDAAPAFCWMVQNVLWEDMLLHISRPTDPPASGMGEDKENLTIRNLLRLVKDRAIKADLHMLVNTAGDKVKSIRDWRNHRIARCNLDLAINNGSRPLASADKEQVREAMHAIREVLTVLEQRYIDTETVFIGSITHRGALDVLHVLYFGIREKAKADERIRCRKATEDDYPALALRDET